MLLSVIVPVYNTGNFLKTSINCLKKQNIDAEYIIINDGSTDKSYDVIFNQCTSDSRFKIINHDNCGYGKSCNIGIDISNGDFIAIYEPDDFIDNDFYFILLKKAKCSPLSDIIRYNGFIADTGCHNIKRSMIPKEFTEANYYSHDIKKFYSTHPSLFNGIYRKNFILDKKIKFCSGSGACLADSQFFVRLYYASPNIYIIDKQKYHYRIHQNQSVNQIINKKNTILKNWYEEYNFLQSNNIYDFSFYMYRFFHQYEWICKKNNIQIKKEDFKEISQFIQYKYKFIKNLPLKENIKCLYFYS